MQPADDMFGGALGPGLWDFAQSLGAPLALRDLAQADPNRAADIVVKTPYWNPRPVERGAARALLQDAGVGARPA